MHTFLQRTLSKIKKSSTTSRVLFGVFLLLVIFTRFYNLAGTARFTQDESSDLARMHEYYVNKQISLVGPISNDRSKVFSSLSYYMVMPFAVAFEFTPVSPVYGMAFLGVLTAIFILLIVRSVNKKYVFLVGALITIWYPLVLMSRWAWNPHFVAFWAALGILLYQYRKQLGAISYFGVGIALGAMFHHHYVAIVTTAPFLFFISLPLLKQKKYLQVLLLATGYMLPHLVFVLFDLKNPPGLFFGKYLQAGETPHVETELTIGLVWEHFIRNLRVYLATFVTTTWIQFLFGLSLLVLLYKELKSHSLRTLTWMVPGTAIIFAGVFLDDFQIRYVFSSILFVLVWLVLPRKKFFNKLLARFAIFLLFVGSLVSIHTQLTVADVPPSMRVLTQASHIIIDTIKTNKLNNANVAALSSPDDAPLAERYRDYIRMKETGLRAESEYDVSEHLFVISTATNEELREDKSYAMLAFEDKGLRDVFEIENSEWKVFWYGTD